MTFLSHQKNKIMFLFIIYNYCMRNIKNTINNKKKQKTKQNKTKNNNNIDMYSMKCGQCFSEITIRRYPHN